MQLVGLENIRMSNDYAQKSPQHWKKLASFWHLTHKNMHPKKIKNKNKIKAHTYTCEEKQHAPNDTLDIETTCTF